MAAFRVEIHQGTATFESEIRQEVASFGSDIRQEMATLGSSIRNEIARDRVTQMRWMVGLWAAQVALLLGTVLTILQAR